MNSDLLDLIDNEIRRKILSILSVRPSYTFELARFLGSSQQLVAKHIKMLEDSGLVYKVGKIESDSGPPRILYKANLPLLSFLQFIENISSAMDGEESEYNPEGNVRDLVERLKEIDGKIKLIETDLKNLMLQKQKILLAISNLCPDTETSLFFRAVNEALQSGNFDLIIKMMSI
ncbi:MAG: helix-turn-helix domain-containing protein [Thermoplasmatales archaeon]